MANNPRAFPCGDQHNTEPDYGMTLRDWFAGQALVEVASLITFAEPATYKTVAQFAYEIADAMLAEREKKL